MKETLTYLGSHFSNRFGDKFFNADIVDFKVIQQGCCDTHVKFKILVKRGKNSWVVFRRYREFLHIKDVFEEREVNFPPKTWFSSIDESFLEERRQKLAIFLDNLLKNLSQDDKIFATDEIGCFLGLDSGFDMNSN